MRNFVCMWRVSFFVLNSMRIGPMNLVQRFIHCFVSAIVAHLEARLLCGNCLYSCCHICCFILVAKITKDYAATHARIGARRTAHHTSDAAGNGSVANGRRPPFVWQNCDDRYTWGVLLFLSVVTFSFFYFSGCLVPLVIVCLCVRRAVTLPYDCFRRRCSGPTCRRCRPQWRMCAHWPRPQTSISSHRYDALLLLWYWCLHCPCCCLALSMR